MCPGAEAKGSGLAGSHKWSLWLTLEAERVLAGRWNTLSKSRCPVLGDKDARKEGTEVWGSHTLEYSSRTRYLSKILWSPFQNDNSTHFSPQEKVLWKDRSWCWKSLSKEPPSQNAGFAALCCWIEAMPHLGRMPGDSFRLLSPV